MMVKWKKNRNLKPVVVLRKIDGIKTINEDGGVSYSGSEYHDAMATLQNMVEFPKAASGLNQEAIVSKAVNNVAKVSDLDKEKVIGEINRIVDELLAAIEYRFHVLTSLSMGTPYPAKSIEMEGCRIRIIDSTYPKKYTGREDAIKASRAVVDATIPGYANVIVSLRAKSERGAATSALRALDIQRAIWCLFTNPSMEFFGDEWSPINRIRLGSAHTIHRENGSLATKMLWHEPNFVPAKIFSPVKPSILAKNSKWVMERITDLTYGETIKDALLRYVRALDERDQNVALIRLWGALEALTTPGQANYDLVTRRASFLFSERDYHRQVLEHLRDYRNRSVHSGDQSERAKTNCFQLQFYFYHLVLFHLKTAGKFENLAEANSFLDLPPSKGILEKRKRLIEAAIEFVS